MKVKAESLAFDKIKLYSHNFGDFMFYKSMNFRSSYPETLAENRNRELNHKARRQAVEYHLEVLFLQFRVVR